MSLAQILSQCIERWRRDGIPLGAPQEESRIRSAWASFNQPLSADVLSLYATIGGFGNYVFDDMESFWFFWPWDTLVERNAKEPREGVVFCDHSIGVLTWEFRFENESTSSVWLSQDELRAAPSVEAFFQIYFDDPNQLLFAH
jgi:hypothetical protein